jgi:predicted ABC-type ATPase
VPELHIITGSNGAGKSTVGRDYLPENIRNHCEIFNGDKVFQDKKRELWLQGIRAIKESRKIASDFVDNTFDSLRYNAISKSEDFCYEGHFTNEATWNVPREFKNVGYSIHLIFFGLSDPELSQLRVIDRTKEGGHYVTPLEVEANFYGNLEKLDKHFEMFDTVQMIDTSETDHLVIATFTSGIVHSSIEEEDIPEWFTQNLPIMTNRIKAFKSNN